MLEWRNDGILEEKKTFRTGSLQMQHPIIPAFHHSGTLSFHYSTLSIPRFPVIVSAR
jgi:hypothetical protein